MRVQSGVVRVADERRAETLLGLRMPIGNRVKELRVKRGMTQLELAKVTGLSLSIITQLEQGLTADPKMSTLKALAKALGVTMDELAANDEPPPKRGQRKGGQ